MGVQYFKTTLTLEVTYTTYDQASTVTDYLKHVLARQHPGDAVMVCNRVTGDEFPATVTRATTELAEAIR